MKVGMGHADGTWGHFADVAPVGLSLAEITKTHLTNGRGIWAETNPNPQYMDRNPGRSW